MNQPEEYGYEAKFSVRTDFLDTTFRRSRQQREGETYEDFVAETHKMFLSIAERIKGEAIIDGLDMGWGPGVRQPPSSTPSPMPIIDKKWDQFEIDIDDAQTLEKLEGVIESYGLFPAKFLPIINTKREILRIEANNKSMGEKNSRP